MTDTKRNSELYVSPRPSMPIEVEKSLGLPWRRGEQNSLFPAGPVMECSVIPPNSKIEKKATKKSFALRGQAHKFVAVSRNTTWSRASRKLLSSGISDFLFALCPGQTDRQVVAGGRKLNLRRDLRWVAKRTGKFSSQAHASRNKTISRQVYPVLHWLIIGSWTSLNLRWLGLWGQTVKKLLWLAGKFDLDQSEHRSSQVNASTRKPWPNGVASRPKFSTCVYLRLRLTRA